MKTKQLRPAMKWFTLATVMTVLALALVASGDLPSKGKTSAEMRGLNFSHTLHVEKNGLECATCHKAGESTTGRDDLLPGHNVCADCHEVKDDTKCSTCHLGKNPVLSSRITSYAPKFNHALHVGTAKLECAACHTNLDMPLVANQVGHLPKMADCMECHTQKLVSTDCNKCHSKTDDLQPTTHKVDWMYHHGAMASASGNDCRMCHTTESCQDCHNGDAVLNPHPRNYVSRHGQDAHLSDVQCAVCHEQREFCNDCHRAMNVLPAGHFRPDWVTAGGGRHGDEAEADLESCMSCHSMPGAEPICASCHKK